MGDDHVLRTFLFIAIGGLLFTMDTGSSHAAESGRQEGSALRFKMKTLEGEDVDLAKYGGKVVMVVNVASRCGYTPQYEQLQQLHEKYAQRGLAILGFPCNQFLRQEPGSATQIREFCRVNYGVTFDMFAKVDVKGENACELYRFLTSVDTKPKGPGKIGWNFEKFILDRSGMVVARFGSSTRPDAREVLAAIERELARPAPSRENEPSSRAGLEAHLNLSDYLWKNRVLLAFAPARDDQTIESLRRGFAERTAGVSDRDLLLIEVIESDGVRIANRRYAEASGAQLRQQFRIAPGSTVLVLVGKDGAEKLRKTTVRLDELFAVIDAMPMRRQEIEESGRR